MGLEADPTALAKVAWAIAHLDRVHLKILKESGRIRGEVDGPKVCYCINPD